MKISTIRTLILAADVALVGGIGGVVYDGMQEKKTRAEDSRNWKRQVMADLAEVQAIPLPKLGRGEYPEVLALSFDGKAPKVASDEPPAPVDTTPKVTPARPLGDLMEIRGTEVDRGSAAGSFILYIRKVDPDIPPDPNAGVPAAADGSDEASARPAVGIRVPPRRVPTPGLAGLNTAAGSGGVKMLFRANINDVVEFSGHEVARVTEVGNGFATFEYDGKPHTLYAPKPEGSGTSGAGSAPAAATGPIDPDPKTWVGWSPQNPREIRVTEMGVRAMKDRGEDVLEGVRWGSEVINGRKVIRIDEVPEGNVMYQAGARKGDAIESINGTPVSNKAEVMRYLDANPNLPQYRVAFYRQGARHERTVVPPRR